MDKNKYVLIPSFDLDRIDEYSIIELDDIYKNINTNQVINLIEKTFKEIVDILNTDKFPTDYVTLEAPMGVIVSYECYNKLKERKDFYNGIPELKENYVLNNIVPVEITICRELTGNKDTSLCDEDGYVNYDELSLKNIVYGIIEFDKFIKVLKELGYEVKLYFDIDINTFEEYINYLKLCGNYDGKISITLNKSKNKKIECK